MIEYLGLIIIVMDIIFMLFVFFAEKSNPNKILGWALVFLILPVIGFILYLFIGQSFYSRHAFEVKGITDAQLKEAAIMYRDAINSEENEEYTKIAMTVTTLGGIGYSYNNKTKLYTYGPDKFGDLYADLRSAKKFIYMEYYIIRNDELGNELLQILTEKVKEGLDVRLLTDDVGIGKGPMKSIKEFKKAGGKFAVFHPVLMLALSPKKNNRNHRKIAIIDGDVSYCGGFNVGDEYLGKGPLGYWRDSAVRFEGEACWVLQLRFHMDWAYANKETYTIREEDYNASSYKCKYGDDRVMIVSGGPDVAEFNPVRMEYLEMINRAKKSIYIHSPYFILDDSLTDALSLAAAGGVDVKVIIPDKPDHPFVMPNNMLCAYRVMKNGVKVYMYNRGFVHSKTMVVDGEFCSVGSANFDDRSLVLNFETNAMIFSKEVGKQMDDAFNEDLKYCTEYTVKEYESLGLLAYFKIGIARLFGNLA